MLFYASPETVSDFIGFILEHRQMPPMLDADERDIEKVKDQLKIIITEADYNALTETVSGIDWSEICADVAVSFLTSMLDGFCASAQTFLDDILEL